MSKHTPGPWAYEFTPDQNHENYTSAAWFKVAAIKGNEFAPIVPHVTRLEGFTEEELEANARLIALAPDLAKLITEISGALPQELQADGWDLAGWIEDIRKDANRLLQQIEGTKNA